MDCIEILGGHPLHGRIRVQGSKNAALPILAGTILHKGVTVLHQCPRILDVMYMIQILEEMGCRTWWEGHSLHVDASCVEKPRVSVELGEKMRSSIILMGSLLGRTGEVWIPYPGGCTIGARPIDLHLSALRNMNVCIEEKQGVLYACSKKLVGNTIDLYFPSVGATENIILTAVLADGVTEIKNGAKEPEIQELCRFLNGKGAKITGAGTGCIRIEGVTSLQDSEHVLMADRIVAGTYLMAAAATRGTIFLEDMPMEQMGAVMEVASSMGVSWEQEEHGTWICGEAAWKPVPVVRTAPYPGFPTDLQSQLMAVLSIARGNSLIQEQVFESRFKAAEEINRMGACISVDGQEAYVTGTERGLKGRALIAPELRGGAALVIAGLAAEGKTVIENLHFIQRGYEDIGGDLNSLGAAIRMG